MIPERRVSSFGWSSLSDSDIDDGGCLSRTGVSREAKGVACLTDFGRGEGGSERS